MDIIEIDPDKREELKCYLYKYWPDTLEMVRGMSGVILKKEHNVKIFTDGCWPNMTTVVLTYNEGKMKYMYSFSIKNLAMQVILKSPCFDCLANSSTCNREIELMTNKLGMEKFKRPPDMLSKYIFSLQSNCSGGFVKSLPPQYKLGTICHEDIDLIVSYWEPATYEDLKELMKHFITSYPNAAVYDTMREPAQPVSWVVSSGMGILYHLYTMEEYRGKGFGMAVVQELTQKLLTKEISPVTYIRADKTKSQNVFIKCGYVKMNISSDVVFSYC